MQNQNNPYIDHSSWMDCLVQLNSFRQINKKQNENYKIQVQNQLNKKQKIQQKQQQNQFNQQILQLISLHQCVDKKHFKNSHCDIMIDQQFFASNSQSLQLKFTQEYQLLQQEYPKSGYKKQKYAKQYIYSKNYRDRKKQQFKQLQQENQYLKNKIDDLQSRLRQKQLQINRLKHHSLQKQLTIEQLNRQFLTKVSLFAEKVQTLIDKNIQTPKLPSQRKNILYDQLIRTYDQHGFSGSRKKSILSYYMDQILQVVLRDSQKYLCMLCCKNKDSKLQKKIPTYQKINIAFQQIMQLNNQDQQRLTKYIDFLYPIMKEIRKQCSDMYKNYNKIMQSMNKVHQFMKLSYTNNLDFVKKRMKIQSWFQFHKYHKIMRKLKQQWLDFIKNQKSNDDKNKRKYKFGIKKHKTDNIIINL